MGVDREHRQALVAGRPDLPVDRDRIDAEMIAPNQIPVLGNEREAASQQSVAAREALGEYETCGLNVATFAQRISKRGPVGFENAKFHGALLNPSEENGRSRSAGNRATSSRRASRRRPQGATKSAASPCPASARWTSRAADR